MLKNMLINAAGQLNTLEAEIMAKKKELEKTTLEGVEMLKNMICIIMVSTISTDLNEFVASFDGTVGKDSFCFLNIYRLIKEVLKEQEIAEPCVACVTINGKRYLVEDQPRKREFSFPFDLTVPAFFNSEVETWANYTWSDYEYETNTLVGWSHPSQLVLMYGTGAEKYRDSYDSCLKYRVEISPIECYCTFLRNGLRSAYTDVRRCSAEDQTRCPAFQHAVYITKKYYHADPYAVKPAWEFYLRKKTS